MFVQEPRKLLLSIIEPGGYPNFTPVNESPDHEVAVAMRMHQPPRLSRVDVSNKCSTLVL